ncbi:hypothetical protein [Acaryochloris sp. IP29b_bin.137]|uniref:hypothetical protein n=1 Tax=Acaryochloris sp. IP29b_bin.137 TaxID=2969217 RepID=UPI0026283236|nr:hypothetical protein [Acaryochloris sp. IP29b_bin.137]
MTSQTILAEPATTQQSVPTRSMDNSDIRLFETVKHVYKSDHQAEYLEIKAQVESLLQQLQAKAPSDVKQC